MIIHDIAFPTAKIGYAVGEEGQVWKTTDGGNSWVQQVLVSRERLLLRRRCHHREEGHYLRLLTVRRGAYGVFRWTEDGGSTWSSDMSPGPEWLQQVRFVKKQNGLMLTLGPVGGDPERSPSTRPMVAQEFPIGIALSPIPMAAGSVRNSLSSITCTRALLASISAPA